LYLRYYAFFLNSIIVTKRKVYKYKYHIKITMSKTLKTLLVGGLITSVLSTSIGCSKRYNVEQPESIHYNEEEALKEIPKEKLEGWGEINFSKRIKFEKPIPIEEEHFGKLILYNLWAKEKYGFVVGLIFKKGTTKNEVSEVTIQPKKFGKVGYSGMHKDIENLLKSEIEIPSKYPVYR